MSIKRTFAAAFRCFKIYPFGPASRMPECAVMYYRAWGQGRVQTVEDRLTFSIEHYLDGRLFG